jgi:hypothetical protein
VAEEHPTQGDAWQRAVAACREALVDYQTGLLDEEQLRRTLFRSGMVVTDGEVWLLDVAEGTWRHYDGNSTDRFPPQPDDGSAEQRAYDAATLRRWQRGLEGLPAATPFTGVAGRAGG